MGLKSWLNRPSRKALEQELATTRRKLQALELHKHWVQQVAREEGYTELIEPNHVTEHLFALPPLGCSIESVVFEADPDGVAQAPYAHINRIEITGIWASDIQRWEDTETWELDVYGGGSSYVWVKV